MRLLYRAFNVSGLLQPGPNAAGVRLGFCHYGYIDQAFCVDGHAMRPTCRGFVMRLAIHYADGSVENVVTNTADEGWTGTVAANPMVYTHLYHGEVYDGRMLAGIAGWNEAGFRPKQAADWFPAKPYKVTTAYEGPTQPGLVMSLHTMPPMGVGERRTAVSVKKLELAPPHGRVIINKGRMLPQPAGEHYDGLPLQLPPAATHSTEESCKNLCLNMSGCVQAVWDANVPEAGAMVRILEPSSGYYTGTFTITPNITAEKLCTAKCMAEASCMQVTFIVHPPRENTRIFNTAARNARNRGA